MVNYALFLNVWCFVGLTMMTWYFEEFIIQSWKVASGWDSQLIRDASKSSLCAIFDRPELHSCNQAQWLLLVRNYPSCDFVVASFMYFQKIHFELQALDYRAENCYIGRWSSWSAKSNSNWQLSGYDPNWLWEWSGLHAKVFLHLNGSDVKITSWKADQSHSWSTLYLL